MLFRQTPVQETPAFPSLLLLKARSRRRRALAALRENADTLRRDPAWIVPFRHHAVA